MRKLERGLYLAVIIGVTGCSAVLLFHKNEQAQAEKQYQDLNCELLVSRIVKNACAKPNISNAYLIAHDFNCKSGSRH